MTAPINPGGRPGRTEFSHGRSRAAHPDSDYQTGVPLPWEVAERNQGSKRGGFTQAMRQQAERRLDATNSHETVEEMLYVLGNPDTGAPDEPIVQEKIQLRPTTHKQPIVRDGVIRQR
jgi:hypothetical protein